MVFLSARGSHLSPSVPETMVPPRLQPKPNVLFQKRSSLGMCPNTHSKFEVPSVDRRNDMIEDETLLFCFLNLRYLISTLHDMGWQ